LILPFFQNYFEGYLFLWVTLLLVVASKYFFPFAEDLTLILTGFLSATVYHDHAMWPFWAAGVLSVMLADGSLYWLARWLIGPRSGAGGRATEARIPCSNSL
jgi:membrane protein DedA with SNARE-associated domain